jgi:hypothetical protein
MLPRFSSSDLRSPIMTTDNHQGYARESIHCDLHPINAQCISSEE